MELEGDAVNVYAIWESHLPLTVNAEGREITARIWTDMPSYDGYELLQDMDDPGHLLVVSHWSNRERADGVLHEYANHPNVIKVDALTDKSRRRFVAVELPRN